MPRRSSTALSSTASASSPSRYQASKLHFPLPDDYFPPVSLSLTQVQQYQTQVEDLAADAIKSCRDHENRIAGFSIADDKHWQGVTRNAELSIVRRKEDLLTITRTFGTVTGDFRRFVDFFSSETSEQLFAWNQFFFGCAVDAVALCNLNLHKSDKHATLGIKWTCMQPSLLTRKRDECFLEYIVYTKDDQGRDAAVIVRKPVDIPECPPLPHELKTKREKITTVIVVRESDSCPDKTQVFMLSKCDHKGLPASTKFCKKLLRALNDVSLSADAKRIATTIRSPRSVEQSHAGDEPVAIKDGMRSWVPPTSIQQGCKDCSRTFRAGRRRRFCQICGDAFCSKCLVRRAGIRQEKNNYIAMTSQRTFRVVQLLLCKVCVDHSREEDAKTNREPVETTRSSVISSKSSQATSMTKPQSFMSSTPTTSVEQSSLPHQTDAPRHSAVWDEDTRNSWWSEYESDTSSWKSGSSRFSTISRNCSGAPTVRSSFSSEYSYNRNSFLAVQSLETPCETDADQFDDCIDERSSIYEVIDTKDMMPESELQKQLRSQQLSSECKDSNNSDYFPDAVRNRYTSTPVAPTFLPPRPKLARRTRSTDQNDNSSSSKSLDQCIAEQNELLQQVLSASRGFAPDVQARVKASSASQSFHEDNESHDDSIYEL